MISEDSAGEIMIASEQKAIPKQSSPSELLKVVFEKNIWYLFTILGAKWSNLIKNKFMKWVVQPTTNQL